MSIKTTIAQLEALLTGLQSDAGDVLMRIFTATPEQPQPADFPAMVIEFSPEEEGAWKQEALGLGRNDYRLQILIFVGAPAVTPISELHDAAIAWIKPLADKLVSNITLTGNVTFTGFPDSNITFAYWVQAIDWNQGQFFGLRAILPVTEKIVQTMA